MLPLSVAMALTRANRARPNPAVNTDTHRRGFARAVVAGYLTRYVHLDEPVCDALGVVASGKTHG